jgi:hypothetical protein
LIVDLVRFDSERTISAAQSPEQPCGKWSLNYLDGRRLGLMTLIDEFSRRCLAIRLRQSDRAILLTRRDHHE